MTLGDFLDVLRRLHKLTLAQKVVVAEVLSRRRRSRLFRGSNRRRM